MPDLDRFDRDPEALPLPVGPFESEAEARSHPAVRATYQAMRDSSRRGIADESCHRLLCEALSAAGVELGAYDHEIVLWLANWEPQMCAVFAGLLTRAHQAGTHVNDNEGE